MEIRQHLNVYGRVQGVGFRYRAKRMADAYGDCAEYGRRFGGTGSAGR